MAATPLDYADEALKCEHAIVAIVAGKVSSYTISGRTFTKNDLNTLRTLADYFRRRHAETTHGGTTYADMSGGVE
jgi:putative N-acetylmannosamine-6-phosphate epimerase